MISGPYAMATARPSTTASLAWQAQITASTAAPPYPTDSVSPAARMAASAAARQFGARTVPQRNSNHVTGTGRDDATSHGFPTERGRPVPVGGSFRRRSHSLPPGLAFEQKPHDDVTGKYGANTASLLHRSISRYASGSARTRVVSMPRALHSEVLPVQSKTTEAPLRAPLQAETGEGQSTLHNMAYRLARHRLSQIENEAPVRHSFAGYERYIGCASTDEEQRQLGQQQQRIRQRRRLWGRVLSNSGDDDDKRGRSRIFSSNNTAVPPALLSPRLTEEQQVMLLARAKQNVDAQLADMDRRIAEELRLTAPTGSGGVAGASRGSERWRGWGIRTPSILVRRRHLRHGPSASVGTVGVEAGELPQVDRATGKVEIGFGKFVDMREIEELAAKRMRPIIDDLTERAAKRRKDEKGMGVGVGSDMGVGGSVHVGMPEKNASAGIPRSSDESQRLAGLRSWFVGRFRGGKDPFSTSTSTPVAAEASITPEIVAPLSPPLSRQQQTPHQGLRSGSAPRHSHEDIVAQRPPIPPRRPHHHRSSTAPDGVSLAYVPLRPENGGVAIGRRAGAIVTNAVSDPLDLNGEAGALPLPRPSPTMLPPSRWSIAGGEGVVLNGCSAKLTGSTAGEAGAEPVVKTVLPRRSRFVEMLDE